MADRKLAYAAASSLTITLASLSSTGYRESTAVDNTSNLYLDAQVGGRVQIATVTADGQIEVYAYGSWDGTRYTAGLAGTDAAITWGTTDNTGVDGYNDLVPLGSIAVDTSDDQDDVEFGPFSLAAAFGGRLPRKWGVVVKNVTGVQFHATGTNNEVKFTGIYETIA